jgi:hypothetical protein
LHTQAKLKSWTEQKVERGRQARSAFLANVQLVQEMERSATSSGAVHAMLMRTGGATVSFLQIPFLHVLLS